MHQDIAGPVGTSRFQEINEAYEVLSDPDRRRAHDRDFGEPERVTEVPVRHQPPRLSDRARAHLAVRPARTDQAFVRRLPRALSPQLHRLECAQGGAGGKSDAGRGALAGGGVLRLHDPGWRAGVRCLSEVRRDRPSLPPPLSGVCRLGAFGGAAHVVRPRAAPGPAWDGSGCAARNVRDQQSLSSGAGFDFGRALTAGPVQLRAPLSYAGPCPPPGWAVARTEHPEGRDGCYTSCCIQTPGVLLGFGGTVVRRLRGIAPDLADEDWNFQIQ